MEFEKILFRIHEKFLSIEAIKKSIHVCFYGCLFLGTLPKSACESSKLTLFLVLFMVPLFIYTNIHFKDSYCLSPIVTNYTNGKPISIRYYNIAK